MTKFDFYKAFLKFHHNPLQLHYKIKLSHPVPRKASIALKRRLHFCNTTTKLIIYKQFFEKTTIFSGCNSCLESDLRKE